MLEEKYLNEGCTFKCPYCSTVVIKPQEITVHRTKVDGKNVLTTTTQMLLVSPGVCPNLPPAGNAPNCISPIIPGNWTKYSKNTAAGISMLLESSEFVCSLGQGHITVNKNAVRDTFQGNCTGFLLSDKGLKEKNSRGRASEEKRAESKEEKNKDDLQTVPIIDENREPLQDEEVKTIEDLYCPYDTKKDKCKNCEYANTDATHMKSASIDGDSRQPGKILRDNYENEFNELASVRGKFKKKFVSVEQEYEMFDRINCGTEAHHILSTKDVYEQDKVRYVLKLANFYKYNVNEAYNCIILPALNRAENRSKNELQVKFGEATDYEKKKSKFFAMRETGRQWHGGGHGHDFENEHNIHCYAKEVTNLLNKYMRNTTKQHCRIEQEYYEKDREEFVTTIHKVIDIVRNHLMEFETKPQNSLPYFVSADAYYYAYHALNIRLLIFVKADNGIEVYKYAITRKNGNTIPDSRGNKIFKFDEWLWEKRLVAFCEQIDIAYIDISKGRVKLPFDVTYLKEISLKGIDVNDYLKNNISSIEAELEDVNIENNGVMKRRLLQLKG